MKSLHKKTIIAVLVFSLLIPSISLAQTVDVNSIKSQISIFQDIINYLEAQIQILQAELSQENISDQSDLQTESSQISAPISSLQQGSASPQIADATPVPTTLNISSPTHVYPQDGIQMPEVCGGGTSQIEFDGAVYDQYGNEMPNQAITVSNTTEGINETRFPTKTFAAPVGNIYYLLNFYSIQATSTKEVFNFQSGNLARSVEIDVLSANCK